MIKGYCVTNLDNYESEVWPEHFVSVPKIGERVQACVSGRSLKVVGVTHTVFRSEPCVRIELNK